MIDNSELSRIKIELDRLGQSRWLAVIMQLDENYQGYPLEDENQQPSTAIQKILQSLNPDDTPEARLVHRIQTLDCFSYRAYYNEANGHKIYWNPLEERFLHFKSLSNQTVHYQVDNEYPPSDIIRNWMYDRVKQGQ
jgi:hypothetical protein